MKYGLRHWKKDDSRKDAKVAKKMNHAAASCGVSSGPRMTFPQVVTPKCFNRGSSPQFAWIPAKSMRE